MKVFISGPMTGIEDFNRAKFNAMEKMLKEHGKSVFNPAWLAVDESWSRDDLMAVDIAVLARCDAIVLLPGWENSEGARAEYAYAVSAGKRIYKGDVDDDGFSYMYPIKRTIELMKKNGEVG